MQCQAWSPKREPGSPLDPRSTDCRHMPSCILPYPIRSFEAPIAPRCKILNQHHRSASTASVSINQSINRPIPTGNPALAKQLPAVTRSQHLQRPKPQGIAVTASRSHESNRTAQHIVHTSSRLQTASPAESNRTAFPSRETRSSLFPSFPSLRPSSSPSARHSAQSAHCPRISADYQRTIDPLRTNIRKFRLFSRPPTATSATSPRTARLSHLSKHFPRSQHPLPFPIYRQFPLFA